MSNTNHSIAIDAEQYIYATATFNHPMDFGDGWTLDTGYESPNFDALYFVKFDNMASTATIQHGAPALPLEVFPNPAQGYAQLNLPEAAQVELWTLQGSLALRLSLPAGIQALPLNGLPAGTYLLRAVAGGRVLAGRLVVL